MTNDFYDDAETYALAGKTVIEIAGETSNRGMIDITALPLRSLIIKEALPDNGSNRFIGAYRYDGYSLYDILNGFILDKKNEEEFPPIIDMFVTVENEAGESVVLSWGELYYPVHRHEIIIATRVARIVPSKSKDLWPLPQEVKLVVGHDLLTERNISNPVKITIHSSDRSFKVNRDLSPLYSPMITIYNNNERAGEIVRTDENMHALTYETIFYGRGRGIHSTTPFNGILLKELLGHHFSVTPALLRQGYFIIASVDGYRCVFTFSEIFNRNDQSEVLLVENRENEEWGAFRLFPAADFFSDRSVKAVSEIWLIK
ncbi:MAG: hypothetical protein R6W71_06155 [Bacteroidales bacterium]